MQRNMNIFNIFRADTDKNRLGKYGERAAAKYMRRHGYIIKAKNFTAADAEIDLICETADTTVFVEVKTRSVKKPLDGTRPASAVTAEKQCKILRASRFYRSRGHVHKRQRFDIVEVYADTSRRRPRTVRICHIPGAFNHDTAHKGHRS